jgi:hypothetical protein
MRNQNGLWFYFTPILALALLLAASCRFSASPTRKKPISKAPDRAAALRPWASNPPLSSELPFLDLGEPRGQTIGSVGKDGYRINTSFAVEDFENGQPVGDSWQAWDLTADRFLVSVTKNFFEYTGPEVGSFIRSEKYDSFSDAIKNVQWENDELDFTLMPEATEVSIRFEVEGSFLYLASFSAAGSGRDMDAKHPGRVIPVTHAYKIPEYTYVLNVPLVMTGQRPANERAWDRMFRTLSKEDQNEWRKAAPKVRLAMSDAEVLAHLKELALKHHVNLDAAGELPPALIAEMNMYVLGRLQTEVRKSSLSADGRKKLLSYLDREAEALQ